MGAQIKPNGHYGNANKLDKGITQCQASGSWKSATIRREIDDYIRQPPSQHQDVFTNKARLQPKTQAQDMENTSIRTRNIHCTKTKGYKLPPKITTIHSTSKSNAVKDKENNQADEQHTITVDTDTMTVQAQVAGQPVSVPIDSGAAV